jgi:hypothetical protein
MISLPRIARLAEAREFDRLLDEVVRNGRPLPLAIRLRLSDPEALPAAAVGFALQRVVQLTYKPTPLSAMLARMLVEMQHEDGSFGPAGSTAIAVAALLSLADQVRSLPRAWARLDEGDGRGAGSVARAAGHGRSGERSADQARPSGSSDPASHASRFSEAEFGVDRSGSSTLQGQVEHAALIALHSLHEMQDRSIALLLDGQPGLIGDKLDSAIVLWQLGADPRFAHSVRYEDLLSAAVDAGVAHDRASAPLVERIVGQVRGPWG